MDAQRLPASIPRGLPLESLPLQPLLTQEFDRRPDLVYERLRHRYGQVAPVELAGVPVWLVLGHDEVRSVLQDEELWRKETRHWRAKSEGRLPADWPVFAGYRSRHMAFADGEEGRGIRRTFEAALRPFQDPYSFQARRLRLDIQQHADELIETFTSGHRIGWADLCSQYARPLALMVINRLYGFPAEQAQDVMTDIWRMIDGSGDAPQAVHRVREAMTALVLARRVEPCDDLPSNMLVADPALTPQQLGRELFMIAMYLSDVMCNTISSTLIELRGGTAPSLSHELIGKVVDRAVSAHPPSTDFTFRFPVQDIRLGQFTITAGDAVIPAAVTYDTAGQIFSSGDPHLAWGSGPHGCPPAARELATTIATNAVARLTHWFAKWELALPADQLPWRVAYLIRGLRTLPVRFELHGFVLEPEPQIDTQSKATAGKVGTPALPEPVPNSQPVWRRFLAGWRPTSESGIPA
jgi:cytochrome P450